MLEDPAITERTGIHQLENNVTLEWLREGRIAAFEVRGSHRETVDTYIETYISVIRSWPDKQVFLTMLIATHQDSSLTPYVRKRTQDVIEVAKEKKITGRFALVLRRNVFLNFVRIFMKANRANHGPLGTAMFFTQEEALAWLEKMIPE